VSESPTLTIRLDESTKKRLEKEAKRSDQTVTEYVSRAVKMRWEGACSTCGRDTGGAMVQPPGLSEAFSSWVDQQVSRPGRSEVSPFVALVTNEPTGNRVYTGVFDKDCIHSSYITLSIEKPRGFKEVLVPVLRQYIVAWESQEYAHNLRDRLVMYFRYWDVALQMFPQLEQERSRL